MMILIYDNMMYNVDFLNNLLKKVRVFIISKIDGSSLR